jgi:hypothetical protein
MAALNLAGRYRVELSTVTGLADRLWGDDLYGDGDNGTAGEWTDLACDVDALTLENGRRAGLTRPDVGRVSLTVAGWWPPIAAPNRPPLGRPFRVQVDTTGTGSWAPLFVGTLEDATMTQEGTPAGPIARWQLVATDVLGTLQRINPQQGEYPRPAEPVLSRIAALCAFAGVSYTPRTNTTNPGLQARNTAQPVLQELGVAADSAGLVLGSHRAGGVLVLPEHPEQGWPGRTWHAGPQPANPTDQADPAVRWLGCPTAATVRVALGDLVNRFTVGNAGQPATVHQDTASIATYRRRDYQRTDLIASQQATASTLGADWLARYATPAARIAELVIPFGYPDQLDPLQVAAELNTGDTLTVRLPPDDTGTVWTGIGQVLGYRWDLTPFTAELVVLCELPARESDH